MLSRRLLLGSVLGSAALATVPAVAQPVRPLRIGYQKHGIMVVAKQRGVIEAALQKLGAAPVWIDFPFGPPILEALRAGAVDLGYTGDAPPIFAQAAKSDLIYVAALPDGGAQSAILLPPGSAVQKVADLKGKRVAFARASSAHNMIIAALQQAGLQYSDIQPVTLAPADAASAFLRGAVDAWTTWDPYYAIAEGQPGVRVLIRSKDVAPQNGFVLSSNAYAKSNADLLHAAVAALTEANGWAAAHREDVAQILTEGSGVPIAATRQEVARSHYTIGLMTPAIVAEQQAIADRFHQIGLLPAPVKIADAVWNNA